MANQPPANVARENMVDSQVRPNQVNDRRVIDAMRALPREAFAPAGSLAYADADIDLGGGRFLLSPMVTARLAQLALANSPKHVLVVGAGSGYSPRVLAASAGAEVVALEEERPARYRRARPSAPSRGRARGKLPPAGPPPAPMT